MFIITKIGKLYRKKKRKASDFLYFVLFLKLGRVINL